MFPGVTCSWDFLEAHHGKGPCDGLGGSVKKSAEIAIKSGSIISSGQDFYNWAKSTTGSVKYVYVDANDVKQCERHIRNATLVKGISGVHSLRIMNNFVYMRETSCYKVDCCRYAPTCNDWVKSPVKVVTETDLVEQTGDVSDDVPASSTAADIESSIDETSVPVVVERPTNGTEVESMNDQLSASVDVEETASDIAPVCSTDVVENIAKYSVGTMVNAIYGRKQYVGKILLYAHEVDEYYITFMEKKKRSQVYVWPDQEDEVWIKSSNVLNEVSVDKRGYVKNVKSGKVSKK